MTQADLNQTEKAKIMDRIAKLLRMANDASSPEEAAIAAQRARKLMDIHQLHEGQIDLNNSKFKEAMSSEKYGEFEPVAWWNIVATAVAKYNDCSPALIKGFFTFRGFESDVKIAISMTRYLTGRVEKFSDDYMKAQTEIHGKRPSRNVADAYRKGMVRRLSVRLAEMSKSREADEELRTSSGTSLMIIKKDQVEEHFGVAVYENKPQKIFGKADFAFGQGHLDADKIAINDMIEAKPEPEEAKLKLANKTPAERDGYETGYVNKSDPNPYIATSKHHEEWQKGYIEGCKDREALDV
jgi:hypothetical protein